MMMIGNKNFLDISEHFISVFDQDLWFSLYESDTPSYFICYNIVNPISLGTVLEINFEQLCFSLIFFSSISCFKEVFYLFFNKLSIISITTYSKTKTGELHSRFISI